jgi:hypothetical protein
MRVDELRDGLAAGADRVRDDDPAAVRDRLVQVDHRIEVLRRRRRAVLTAVVSAAAIAVIAGLAAVPGLVPDDTGQGPDRPDGNGFDMVQPPPQLVGHQLPPTIQVNDVDYEYFRSQQSAPGRSRMLVAIAPDEQPQALAWVSSPMIDGRVVVTVDGNRVGNGHPGDLETGLLLSADRSHLVVVRATRPETTTRLGLAVYRWPEP